MPDVVAVVKDNMTFENVISTALHVPGVKIDRASFLRKELKKYYSDDVIDDAIAYNPAHAGIPKAEINSISKDVINYETTKVTAVSALAGLPGGAAAIGAASADITSYFAHVLRVVQELAYLYGFEEFDFSEDDIDSVTMNYLLVFMGVMFGVEGATRVLQKLADSLAKQVAKKLAQKALTKGTIYPIVKKVALAVGVRMTKQIFASGVASAIPIIGAAASGSLTYLMFKPCCKRLKKSLQTYNLCDPKFYKDYVDADYTEVYDLTESEN